MGKTTEDSKERQRENSAMMAAIFEGAWTTCGSVDEDPGLPAKSMPPRTSSYTGGHLASLLPLADVHATPDHTLHYHRRM